jgi:hypothetical protein
MNSNEHLTNLPILKFLIKIKHFDNILATQQFCSAVPEKSASIEGGKMEGTKFEKNSISDSCFKNSLSYFVTS